MSNAVSQAKVSELASREILRAFRLMSKMATHRQPTLRERSEGIDGEIAVPEDEREPLLSHYSFAVERTVFTMFVTCNASGVWGYSLFAVLDPGSTQAIVLGSEIVDDIGTRLEATVSALSVLRGFVARAESLVEQANTAMLALRKLSLEQ